MKSSCLVCFNLTLACRTYELLMSGNSSGSDFSDWQATGGVEVKGKGRMETYVWRERKEGKRPSVSSSASSRPPLPAGNAGDDSDRSRRQRSPASMTSKDLAAAAISGNLRSRINLDQVKWLPPCTLLCRVVSLANDCRFSCCPLLEVLLSQEQPEALRATATRASEPFRRSLRPLRRSWRRRVQPGLRVKQPAIRLLDCAARVTV